MKLFQKRGQITIFIMIAILLVVFIALFFFARMDYLAGEEPPEVQIINEYIQKCVETTAEDALHRIGQTGGYYLVTEDAIADIEVAYYLDKDSNLMPSKEQIELELSAYMDDFLFFCTQSFTEFSEVDIVQSPISTQTRILNDKVI